MPASHPDRGRVQQIFALLDEMYRGETWHWSPEYVRDPIDVLVGAILVQHTTWSSAVRALEAMRSARVLEAGAIAGMPAEELIALIRVCGTPAIKAKRLRALAETVLRHGGLAPFLELPTPLLRTELLATHGIGPETADAILLYAAGRRVFEIDAYTKRMFRRIGFGPEADSYDAWQAYFEDALAPNADIGAFQRYHAHIVLHGKRLCRAVPRCGDCPLSQLCVEGTSRTIGAVDEVPA